MSTGNRKDFIRDYDGERDNSPGCEFCARRDGCERYQEGTWCTRFTREIIQKEGLSPSEKWAQGYTDWEP